VAAVESIILPYVASILTTLKTNSKDYENRRVEMFIKEQRQFYV